MYVRRVLKFGGAALADGPSVERVCKIVLQAADQRPVVIVSAHHGVTDLLETVTRAAAQGSLEADRVRIRHRTLLSQLQLDPELCDRHLGEFFHLLSQVQKRGRLLPRELDFALSFGERMSTRIVAQTLQRMGVDATPVDAWDLGFTSDSNHGRARLLDGLGDSIAKAIDEVPGIAVVTGFLAKDRAGNLTTLGRNGSDLTASVIAESIGAAEIQFWKTVGGIMTADPELVPEATVIDRLTYAEAAEYAFHGARILHPASVAPTLRAQVSVRVCSVLEPDAPGTVFENEVRRGGPVGIATKREVLLLELDLDAPERRSQKLADLFRILDEHGVTPSLLSASGEQVSVVIDPSPGLPAVLSELGPDAHVERGLAVAAVIGQGVGRDRTLGMKAHEALHSAGVEVTRAFLGSRDESQAFVVREEDLPTAAKALHGGVIADGVETR